MKQQPAFNRLPILLLFVSFLFTESLFSQICSGSLGDPVVNVTFGAGTNPGPALPANSINNYNYNAGDCPNDGSYTITNSTTSCFSDSWLSYTEDHTPGDVNGYMMLVNASYTPGDFYVDTVKNLCGGTTYEFSAWITNVIKSSSSCSGTSIKPNLVFNIETPSKDVLGTYSTGDINATNAPEWKQYGLFFTTPPGSSTVVIRITNNAPGGCGNDLALDDITFRPCGPKVTVAISNNNNTVISFCKDAVQPVTINGTVGDGYSLPSLQWQESLYNDVTWNDVSGATGNSFVFNKTAVGTYLYRLAVAQGSNISSSNCRITSEYVIINIRDLPLAEAKSNSPVCETTTVQLEADGGVLYNWAGPNGFLSTVSNPSFTAALNSTGNYKVDITDANGCKASASTSLSVLPKPTATVSNDKTICSGNSTTLSAGGGISYLWFPAQGISDVNAASPTTSPAATTAYNVVVSNADNCKDTATVTITVNESPVANAGPDKFMLKGETVTLNGTASGGDVTVFWEPADFLNDPTILNPVTNITHDTIYTLHVVSNNGCGTDKDEVEVKVYNGIFIPKAFSPNNDGLNDTWHPEGMPAFPKAVIRVYDRFGKKVFEGSSISVWDGNYKNQPASAGAYVYYLDLKNGKPIIKGNLVLIR